VSTRVEAGSVPVISADFARHRVVTQMLKGWNSLFQSKKYIRSKFPDSVSEEGHPLHPDPCQKWAVDV
jgi:hypothetical protein